MRNFITKLLVVVILYYCQYVHGSSDFCSITNSSISFRNHFNRKNESLIVLIKGKHENQMKTTELHSGAILTVWASSKRNESQPIPRHYECQVQTHEDYSLKYGYKHYKILDTLEMQESRKHHHGDLEPHWIKLQAIRDVMYSSEYRHPWILYLDADGVIPNATKDFDNSITTFLKNHDKSSSIFVPEPSKGWSSDMIFFKNNPTSQLFIENLWALRHSCPRCVAEQCAVHIALVELLQFEASKLVHSHGIEDIIEIGRDRNIHNCCMPRSHCEYPDGMHRNGRHGNQVQGCTWFWENALNFTSTHRLYGPISKELPTIREYLDVKHPVKNDLHCLPDGDTCCYDKIIVG